MSASRTMNRTPPYPKKSSIHVGALICNTYWQDSAYLAIILHTIMLLAWLRALAGKLATHSCKEEQRWDPRSFFQKNERKLAGGFSVLMGRKLFVTNNADEAEITLGATLVTHWTSTNHDFMLVIIWAKWKNGLCVHTYCSRPKQAINKTNFYCEKCKCHLHWGFWDFSWGCVHYPSFISHNSFIRGPFDFVYRLECVFWAYTHAVRE